MKVVNGKRRTHVYLAETSALNRTVLDELWLSQALLANEDEALMDTWSQ